MFLSFAVAKAHILSIAATVQDDVKIAFHDLVGAFENLEEKTSAEEDAIVNWIKSHGISRKALVAAIDKIDGEADAAETASDTRAKADAEAAAEKIAAEQAAAAQATAAQAQADADLAAEQRGLDDDAQKPVAEPTDSPT